MYERCDNNNYNHLDVCAKLKFLFFFSVTLYAVYCNGAYSHYIPTPELCKIVLTVRETARNYFFNRVIIL